MDQTTASDHASFPRICVAVPPAQPRLPDGFSELAADFEAATGWVLNFDESHSSRRSHQANPADSIPRGKISICDMSASWPAGTNTASRMLCDRIAEKISQLFEQRQFAQIRLQEAGQTSTETQAQGLPYPLGVQKIDRQEDLSNLFGKLLRSCCDFAGVEQAAICLLDDSTKTLKTQFAEGCDGLLGESRSLSHCVADVEALCGAAIVMENTESVKLWGAPVESASALCLPISSTKSLLGTLWLFGAEERDYRDETLNLLELIAGRMAAELELAAAWQEVTTSGVELLVGEEELASKDEFTSSIPVGQAGEPFQANYVESCDGELSDSAPQTVNETAKVEAQPPFAGWTVELGEGEGVALWRVTSDEQMIALVVGGDDATAKQGVESILDSFALAGDCDVQELLSELSSFVDSERIVVAMIDPLIGEVQLVQSGAGSRASLVGVGGNAKCFTRSHACFMCRGQSLQLGASGHAGEAVATLTFRRD